MSLKRKHRLPQHSPCKTTYPLGISQWKMEKQYDSKIYLDLVPTIMLFKVLETFFSFSRLKTRTFQKCGLKRHEDFEFHKSLKLISHQNENIHV